MPSVFWSKQSTRNQQSNLYRALFLYINLLILSPQLYSNPGQWHSLWNSQWHRQCHSWCIDIGIVNSNDIVSPVHNVSFCAQKLTYSVSFWTQILTHHASYWIKKTLNKPISARMDFCVSIEVTHNPKHVTIVLSFSIGQSSFKKKMGAENDKICRFLGPKTTHSIIF